MFADHIQFETGQPVAVRMADTIPLNKPAVRLRVGSANERATFRVLDAQFSRVKHCREFCRVEAYVTVTYLYHPAMPPLVACLLTSVPLTAHGYDNNVRTRLIESAVRLSVLLNRQNASAHAQAA